VASGASSAIIIDRSVEDVWKYVTDISNMPLWEDSAAVWKQTSAGPLGLGTTIQSSIRALGRTVRFDLRVTEFEVNRTFSVEAVAGRTRGTTVSYVFAPIGERTTRLSRVTVAQFHGILKVLQPFVGLITTRTGQLEARNVKRLMESDGNSEAP